MLPRLLPAPEARGESESAKSQSAIGNPQSAIATPVVVSVYFVYNIFKNQAR